MGGGLPDWVTLSASGIALKIAVTPGAAADRVVGLRAVADDQLCLGIEVRQDADDPATEVTIQHLIAEAVGIAPTAVTLSETADVPESADIAGDHATLITCLMFLLRD
ncbi:MAG: hypothetical protein AAFP23_06070 [Pseudomonadota bacterium]